MQTFDERSKTTDDRTDATVRMTVQEAAEALGVTVEAIRGRMHRGKYLKEKDDEGRVWVLIPPDQLPNGRPEVHERWSERSGSSLGERSRTDRPTVYKRLDAVDAELVEELRGEVAYLKDVIATRDDELRRKDTIIMQMAQRIPGLPSPSVQEPPDEPERSAEGPGGPQEAADPVGGAGPREGDRRPWWLRWLGG